MRIELSSYLYKFLLFRYISKIKEAISYSIGIPIVEANIININAKMVKYPVGINIKDNMRITKDICIKFKEKIKLDTSKEIKIFCTGESGTIMASFFAQELMGHYPFVKVININKRGIKTHRDSFSEINGVGSINIFIDDHIHSGNTLFQVYRKILNENKEGFIFDYVVVSNINNNNTLYIIKKSGIVKTIVFNQNI